jgi:protein gp37
MADNTQIEWTDATWNPVTGCTKISPGCLNCYAERIAERFRGVKGHPYEQGFDLRLWPARLALPFCWKRPRNIFVNSMSDLFHRNIPKEFVGRIFSTMEQANWHTYQVLTKRSSVLRHFLNERFPCEPAPSNIWLGVSIENAATLKRLDNLRRGNASVRFLSIEPLLGPVGSLDLDGIHWVIAGGESGPNFRPAKIEWLREIRDQCTDAGVPFFFKQWGGIRPKSGGNELDGRTWMEYPKTHSPLVSHAA